MSYDYYDIQKEDDDFQYTSMLRMEINCIYVYWKCLSMILTFIFIQSLSSSTVAQNSKIVKRFRYLIIAMKSGSRL